MSSPLPFSTRPHPLNDTFHYLDLSNVGHVTCVGLNRPEKRNAIHGDMWLELGRVFALLGDDDNDNSGSCCRAILLFANGSTFSSGIDLTDESLQVQRHKDVAHTGLAFLPKLRHMQECFTQLERCSVPVIAAVHGKCIGAGVDLICAADIVWCSRHATFSVREVAIGLTADIGTLQRLPKRTGNSSLVHELCYTGRDMDSREALQVGLVGRILDCREELLTKALELCAVICSYSPIAVQGTKRALLYARDHSVAEGLEQVAQYNSLALQSQDLTIAWKAARSMQKPRFPDLPRRSKL